MDSFFERFRKAFSDRNGYLLADTLTPGATPEQRQILHDFIQSTNHASVESDIRSQILSGRCGFRLSQEELNGWVDVYVAFWRASEELFRLETNASYSASSWPKVYAAWEKMTLALVRGYTNHGFEAWTVPAIYVAGKYLRIFAIKTDEEGGAPDDSTQGFQEDQDEGEYKTLEAAARLLNRLFSTCLSDRAPLEESRKWGVYNTANLLFKTYFKLNQTSLAKNLILAVQSGRTDMPQLEAFPLSHQVTFKYYVGVIHFLGENYAEAEEHLTSAFELCHKDAKRNKELILTYLIPCHLITNHTQPSEALLAPFPRLQSLFLPLCRCIKRGDLAGFDAALSAGEEEFVKRRIYLTLERGRDIALRNLLRKVYIAGGFEEAADPSKPPARRARVPIDEFHAGINLGSKDAMERDEVECLLANMIYKGHMKGYIHKERGLVLLSKTSAFPGTDV